MYNSFAVVCVLSLLYLKSSWCHIEQVYEFPVRSRRASDVNLLGSTVSGFYITVYLGKPPQEIHAILDTGSSNFAVAGYSAKSVTRYYNKSISSTAVDLNYEDLRIKYTEGSWSGSLVEDVISVPSAGLDSTVKIPIAVISSSQDFFISGSNWEAIMGLAYSGLVQPSTLHLQSVFETIVESRKMDNLFSMQLCSFREKDNTQGVFTIGKTSSRLSSGAFFWTKIVHKLYYEVLITKMQVGNTTLPFDCKELNDDKSIVDSGTTNLRLPKKVFESVVNTIKISVSQRKFPDAFFEQKEMFCDSKDVSLFDWFPKITIFLPSNSSNNTFALVIYPQSYLQYMLNGSNADTACFKFGIFPSTSGTVLGTVVMEQYYVVFDRDRSLIGFARSSCTWIPPSETVIHKGNSTVNLSYCLYVTPSSPSPTKIVAFVILGLLGLCFIPICVLSAVNLYRSRRKCWCFRNSSDSETDSSELLQNN